MATDPFNPCIRLSFQGPSGKTVQGSGSAYVWTRRRALRIGVAALTALYSLGLAATFNPLMHMIVLVPIWLVSGPMLASALYKIFVGVVDLRSVDGRCPDCDHALAVRRARLALPMRLACASCGAKITATATEEIDLTAIIAQDKPLRLHAPMHVLLLGIGVAMFYGITQIGPISSSLALPATLPKVPGPGGVAVMSSLAQFLTALLVVTGAAGLLGRLAPRFGQVPVMGEVLAGILLGPSFFGWLAPDAMQLVFPKETMPAFGILAQLGVILYMFAVGLELDVDLLKKKGRSSPMISHVSIIVPLLLGASLAIPLYAAYAPVGVEFHVFALFLGVSLAITAFPVLARILTDSKLEKTSLGVLAIACAAVDDVTAWCLLALVVCLATFQGFVPAAITVGLTVLFFALIWLVVRPLAARYLPRDVELNRGHLMLAAAFVLGSALATELIGIHAIFGAFLLGAAMPRGARVTHELKTRFADAVAALLMPAFFAYTGLRTEIGLLSTPGDWLATFAIIGAAVTGKFGGTFVAARLTGHGGREAAALGILLNTRGLVELVVLNVGLDLGVISPKLFTMLVLMALVTTFATTPLLRLMKVAPRKAREHSAHVITT